MSQPTTRSQQETRVALRDHFKVQIEHIEEKMDLQQKSYQQALDIRTAETERRLENLNGEACRFKEIQATLIPRETYEVNHAILKAEIDALKLFRANMEGKASQTSVNISLFLGVAGLGIAILSLLIKMGV